VFIFSSFLNDVTKINRKVQISVNFFLFEKAVFLNTFQDQERFMFVLIKLKRTTSTASKN